ncbi:hypothetical protein KBD45_04965 [Candidatus Dojkabacteria bacterium]|nr:hypothetical protein [Candidatus Dojkabacteria bacterium]
MNNLIGILVGLLLTTAQSNQDATLEQAAQNSNIQQGVVMQDIGQVQGAYINGDPKCKTPQYQPEHTKQIILETQTMDLNFVALAEVESGLYNLSKTKAPGTDNYYRGIFQISDQYHVLNDYCDPAEQVRWLEGKLKAGAKPERLFPTLYKKLYEK